MPKTIEEILEFAKKQKNDVMQYSENPIYGTGYINAMIDIIDFIKEKETDNVPDKSTTK